MESPEQSTPNVASRAPNKDSSFTTVTRKKAAKKTQSKTTNKSPSPISNTFEDLDEENVVESSADAPSASTIHA